MNIKCISLFSLLFATGITNTISYQELEKARKKNEEACYKINHHSKELKRAQAKQHETYTTFSAATEEFIQPMLKKQQTIQAQAKAYENDYVTAFHQIKESSLYNSYHRARFGCLYANDCNYDEAFQQAEKELLAGPDGEKLHEIEEKFLPLALEAAILHKIINAACYSDYPSTQNAMEAQINQNFKDTNFEDNYYFSNLSDIKCVGRHKKMCELVQKNLRKTIKEACDIK
jgi:hypothetical protein